MQNRSLRTWFAFACAGVAVGAVATSAFADIKAFHGSMCKAAFPSQGDSFKYSNTGIEHLPLESTASVVCPLVRDRINSASSLSSIVVELFNSGINLTCTAYSQKEDTSGGTLDYVSATASGSSPAQLSFTGLDSTNGNEGSYMVFCSNLDSFDSIYHVHVNESSSASD